MSKTESRRTLKASREDGARQLLSELDLSLARHGSSSQDQRILLSQLSQTLLFKFQRGDRVQRRLGSEVLQGTISEGILNVKEKLVFYEIQTDDGRYFAALEEDLKQIDRGGQDARRLPEMV